MTQRPRIYLAGPEVFLPDALEVGREKCRICAEAGLEGVFPLDAGLDLRGLSKREAARRIALACEAMMRSCDAAIANLTPFRGVSIDSGTAYELGFMRALGRPVLGYTNTTAELRERTIELRAGAPLSFDCDTPDAQIEDFDLAENLMIEVAVIESGAEVERCDGDAARLMADLSAFRRAVARARKLLIGPRPSGN